MDSMLQRLRSGSNARSNAIPVHSPSSVHNSSRQSDHKSTDDSQRLAGSPSTGRTASPAATLAGSISASPPVRKAFVYASWDDDSGFEHVAVPGKHSLSSRATPAPLVNAPSASQGTAQSGTVVSVAAVPYAVSAKDLYQCFDAFQRMRRSRVERQLTRIQGLYATMKTRVQVGIQNPCVTPSHLSCAVSRVHVWLQWDNPAHAVLLQRLWEGFHPHDAFPGRKSPLWKIMGFQVRIVCSYEHVAQAECGQGI